ncbi:hypothetical protein [Brevibacillus sp. SYSU BS000544]|uniref:hypothetical protein n=1 Tax=Brevibacillus sp. SYSU BS000544 TaxID=3416443 RepID=UPI003CE5417C
MPFFLKILFVSIGCVILLRLFGNRSISQMTVPELALTLLLGPLLILPLHPNTIWEALLGGLLIVLVMIIAGTLQTVMETNGELTVLLQEKKKNATKEDIEQILTLLQSQMQSQKQPPAASALFSEAQLESNTDQNLRIQ